MNLKQIRTKKDWHLLARQFFFILIRIPFEIAFQFVIPRHFTKLVGQAFFNN